MEGRTIEARAREVQQQKACLDAFRCVVCYDLLLDQTLVASSCPHSTCTACILQCLKAPPAVEEEGDHPPEGWPWCPVCKDPWPGDVTEYNIANGLAPRARPVEVMREMILKKIECREEACGWWGSWQEARAHFAECKFVHFCRWEHPQSSPRSSRRRLTRTLSWTQVRVRTPSDD